MMKYLANNHGSALMGGLLALSFLMTLVSYILLTNTNVTGSYINTNKTVFTKQKMLSIKTYLISQARDVDNDGIREPLKERSGNLVPLSVPIQPIDEWGTEFRYCTWDLGSANTVDPNYSQNNTTPPVANMIFRLISAGKDKTFQTNCNNSTQQGDDTVIEGFSFEVAPSFSGSGGTITSTYSRMFAGTTRPSNPNEGDLFYHTTNRTLEKYLSGSWVNVDWQTIVKASPEWVANRLRIQNNQLQISPNGTNWYNCIPAVGANAVELASVDNSSYSLLYWIPPGTTAIIRNANHLPIVYTPTVEPAFSGTQWNNIPYEGWIGLRPSNVAISNGDGQWVAAGNNSVWAGRRTDLPIVPVFEQSNTSENWGYFSLNIRNNQRWLTAGNVQGCGGYCVQPFVGSSTAPANSYWLGTWYGDDGNQFIMIRIALTRLA